jgi:hypothetical protein
MIEVSIPKDLDHYEAKFVGPFTVRQTVCLVAAVPSCILLYNLAAAKIGTDVAGFLCLIPGAIAFLFGWYKPYGMKFEVFVRSVFVTTVLAPSKRKYKTENYFKKIMSEDYEEDDFSLDPSKSPKKKKKRNKSSSVSGYRPSTKAIF